MFFLVLLAHLVPLVQLVLLVHLVCWFTGSVDSLSYVGLLNLLFH